MRALGNNNKPNRQLTVQSIFIITVTFIVISIILIIHNHSIFGSLLFFINGFILAINITEIVSKRNYDSKSKKVLTTGCSGCGMTLAVIILFTIVVANSPLAQQDKIPTKNSSNEIISQVSSITETSSTNTSTKLERDTNTAVETEIETDTASEQSSKSSSKKANTSKDNSESSSKSESSSEDLSLSEPIEMNTLQSLFANLNSSMNRDDIDVYITNNGLMKYAFTWNSGYQIGYEYSAITQRGRDREGEAVDISFDNDGYIKSADYTFHTGFNTQYHLKYENGVFYYDNQECSNGTEAMQKYLSSKNTSESKAESKVESTTSSKTESKSKSKQESKVESKQESKPESKIESKTESKVQSVAPQPQLSAYEFYGNMDSMCYHIKNCQAAQKISDENRFTYTVNAYSRYDAEPVARQYFESQGYHLCGICGR